VNFLFLTLQFQLSRWLLLHYALLTLEDLVLVVVVEVVIFVELTLVVAWVIGIEGGHRSSPAEKTNAELKYNL
jgi:hypothetical protein